MEYPHDLGGGRVYLEAKIVLCYRPWMLKNRIAWETKFPMQLQTETQNRINNFQVSAGIQLLLESSPDIPSIGPA